MFSLQKLTLFHKEIWRYYRAHGRNFQWRRTRDPYRILVSEFMLQQTQVSRAEGKYTSFLKKFPNIQALAKTPLRDVLKEWQGLGYNRRALNLKRLAETVAKDYGGKLPHDFEELQKLSGVGQSTAGAVMAFAFNKPSIFIETNIRRVFIHFFFPRKKNVRDDEIVKVMELMYSHARPPKVHGAIAWCEWYWALFDYGSMLGERERTKNPNRRSAHYKKQSRFEGSRRQLRGKILRLLLNAPQTKVELLKLTKRDPTEIIDVLTELKEEGIVEVYKRKFLVQ